MEEPYDPNDSPVQYLRALSSAAVVVAELNRWAFHRTIAAVDAAVSWLRPEHSVTLFTFVEPLAGVTGHAFRLAMTAMRTGNRRISNDICGHGRFPAGSFAATRTVY